MLLVLQMVFVKLNLNKYIYIYVINIVFVFLIEHMDLVWLSVTQRCLINVYCISILAKEKKEREREGKVRGRGIIRKIKKIQYKDYDL